MNTQPEILQHPNIPKPLHGMAPREIKGKYWWDKTRKAVYAEQDFHCLACGVHKSNAKYHQWLEAHEYYNMDYAKGSMEIDKIVALCHSCHSYIHSGRLVSLVQQNQIHPAQAKDILLHGFRILSNANLKPWYGSCANYILLLEHVGVDIPEQLVLSYEQLKEDQEPASMQQDWSKWHLILEGEKYYGKFKNEREWEQHYIG